MLIERLCGWRPDGTEPNDGELIDPAEREIPLGEMKSLVMQVGYGNLTRDDVKSYFDMDTDAATEYDAIADAAPIDPISRFLYVDKFYNICYCGKRRVPGFTTPAMVRTALGI